MRPKSQKKPTSPATAAAGQAPADICKAFVAVSNAIEPLSKNDKERVLNAAAVLHNLVGE